MTKATREKTLSHFQKSERDLAADVELLREWLKTQAHLPELPSSGLIEFFIVNNKFSLEKAKQKIDMYYTIRSLVPAVYNISNPKTPQMTACWDTIYTFNLPKLLDDVYQVGICKIKDYIPNDFNVNWWIASAFLNFVEVRCYQDFVLGGIVICDEQHLKMEHICRMTPMHINTTVNIMEKVFSSRVKAIHVVNYPPYFEVFLKIIKSILRPKLFDKIILHPSVKSLAEYIPLDMLPSDYGGKEKSIDDLQEDWKKKLNEYQDRFDELDTLRVNESLRPIPMKDIELFGIQGTFKKLNVD